MSDSPHVINRAAAILEAVASAGAAGARLLDLAEQTGISRPTVHRMLTSLRKVGYIEQLDSKRYVLGQQLALLGLAAPPPLLQFTELQTVAQELADKIGDTAYISARYFHGTYYLARAHGSFPVRMESVEVGEIMPLTSTYSGIALMSQLPEEQQESLLERMEHTVRKEWTQIVTPDHKDTVRAAIRQCQDLGYLYGEEYVLPGLTGAAILAPPVAGMPQVVVSISAIKSRMPEQRKDEVLTALSDAASHVQAVLERRSID
ncbi:MAG: helix-turn-helix domain-containing protein [Corynebacterium camporealensis]|uniref:IclR family transcriptional regulator n=1 Tax=Corynebacterium camporealensis TaxID=161896 RepID=UPI002A91918E|nr:helix-turn-helix domain-containing protein [Corynebacterium camporealensis]MDY5841226.1 helix-turn-helix domain-containing protein [Corynebacterium camporealensis]